MNNPARPGFPFSRVRLEHALVLVLALTGCKSDWDRRDESLLGERFDPETTRAIEVKISSFRPGKATLAEVEQTLGPLKVEQLPGLETEGKTFRVWRDRGRGWDFTLSKDGVIESFSRRMHHFTIVFPDASEAEEFDRWYTSRLGFNPVPPELEEGFKPGITRQEGVITAWGSCSSAEALPMGGFLMRWGSHGDNWALEFTPDGVLAQAPQHYVSSAAR